MWHGTPDDEDMDIIDYAGRSIQLPVEIAPSIWLGSWLCVSNEAFTNAANIKVIINCSNTVGFLDYIHATSSTLASDTIVLSLDPYFSTDCFSSPNLEVYDEFVRKFNRIIQNFMSHFYVNNPKSNSLIHGLLNDEKLSIKSPILLGNLKMHLFTINRLIKLLRNVNSNIQVLIASADGNDQISTALGISYLMDNYNYDYAASHRILSRKFPSLRQLDGTFYEQMLTIDSLKKFYDENIGLKERNPGVLMANCKLKRRNDSEELVNGFVSCGDYRKRKMKYPSGY